MGALLNLILAPVATYLVSAVVNLIRGAGLSDKWMLVIVGMISAATTAIDVFFQGDATPSNVIAMFLAGLASTFFHQLQKAFGKE